VINQGLIENSEIKYDIHIYKEIIIKACTIFMKTNSIWPILKLIQK
jgi:hypothetical protein